MVSLSGRGRVFSLRDRPALEHSPHAGHASHLEALGAALDPAFLGGSLIAGLRVMGLTHLL